ncbi:hypothetical protein [Kitasatospora sp. DSM 101779]|uniref:hypothetical protein n=1 Tax=Kitasatospora sp. DSM 101779 TaxID=2853165 RepID=UPI0021D8F518|nr:hypothetical protein [Kitasatospora sp. DSM 101779]MCU7824341.1 hypothetical protein [Kitasatospora sp. DSM 101779]
MTAIRPSVTRDLLHTAWLLAVETALGTGAVYAVIVLLFALASPDSGLGLEAACVALMLAAVTMPVAGVAVTARRGYRIAPVALVAVGPVLVAGALTLLLDR